MSHYSNLIDNSGAKTSTGWNNIELSPRTVQERQRIKWGIDDFASFTWRGVNAFDVFGAFIINNKNSLKFYNGPTFTNEYTKPQYETAAGQLTGVTFAIQKIDFTIGVYWISEKDYRKLIYWLHPYEINTLTFGFEPDYYYQVKLASVDNGTRYIVGSEDGEYMYYTEMKLTFELQGAPVAYGNVPFDFNEYIDITKPDDSGTGISINKDYVAFFSAIAGYSQDDEYTDERNSDLETPIIIESTINLENIKENTASGVIPKEYHLLYSVYATYKDNNDIIRLFEVELKNLNFGPHSDLTSNKMHITYNSENALLFIQFGDSMQEILTRLTTCSSGDRIVDHMFVEQFRIPGVFDDYNFDIRKMKIEYNLQLVAATSENDSSHYLLFSTTGSTSAEDTVDDFLTVQVLSRPRTNLI